MRISWFSAIVLVPLLNVGDLSGVAGAADLDCAACHPTQAGELRASVHANVGMECISCHGGESSYSIPDQDVSRLRRMASTLDGVGEPEAKFDHGASFAGRPHRRDIPERCGSCHSNVEQMNPFGLRTDQVDRYLTGAHGKRLMDTGEVRVAVCTDCHGVHSILRGSDPLSPTYPTRVPETCAVCHEDESLMDEFGLPHELVDEYRRSVHGSLLLDQGDTGAPTCVTCHGNHSAVPLGFGTVGAVCGKCHQHAEAAFASTAHAAMAEHKGCVQCHGGGEGRNFHLIQRITKPAGVMIERYAHLLKFEPSPTREQVSAALNPDPRRIIEHALPTCMECHDDLNEDESLPKLFHLLDDIAEAQLRYVQTAQRLDEVSRGVLLVTNQRFLFEEAKTSLIRLAPAQHTLSLETVQTQVDALNDVCDQVHAELDDLERGLDLRHRALIPIWGFAIVFSFALYIKYKRLKAAYVVPLPGKKG